MKLKKLITGVAAVGLTLSMGTAILLPYIEDSSIGEEQIVDITDYNDINSEVDENSELGENSEVNEDSQVNDNSQVEEKEEVVLNAQTSASTLWGYGNIQSGQTSIIAGETWGIDANTGIFWVETPSSLVTDENLKKQIQLFSTELAAKHTTTALPITYGELGEAGSKDIILVLDSGLSIPTQGYKVEVEDYSVKISASDKDGLFYGCRYLIQQLSLYNTVSETSQAPAVLERALLLDNGRKYYSPEWIKQLIKEMSWSNMNALILHFSEDMGFGLECKTYPWLAGRDGKLCVQAEVETDNSVLSQDELREIAKIAELYHVELIPSFDSPGHMNYIVKTYNEKYGLSGFGIGNYFKYGSATAVVPGSSVGREYAKQFSRGIDISNATAVEFTQNLIKEYAALFKELGCTKFDIGGDELLGWGTAAVSTSTASRWQQLDHWKAYAQNRTGNNKAVAYDGFLLYMNDLYDLVTSYGYTSVRMWNDDALRSSDTGYTGVVKLNPNMQIQYWSDGANGNTVYTFLNQGYSVYNFVDTYNYYAMVPGYFADPKTSFAGTNQKEIYEEWNPYIYTNDHNSANPTYVTPGTAGVKGSSLCVWCDDPTMRTENQVMTELLPLIRANGTKAWDYDANSSVNYTQFVSNVATIGDVPSISSIKVPEVGFLVNTVELQTVVGHYNDFKSELYTTDSFEAYTKAVVAGQAILNSAKPSQTDVDAAVANIKAARQNLKRIANEADWFVQGAFRTKYANAGKVAALSISTPKDKSVVGFVIQNDLGETIKIIKHTEVTKNADRNIHTITFSPSDKEIGIRTYTVYALYEGNVQSTGAVRFVLEVK